MTDKNGPTDLPPLPEPTDLEGLMPEGYTDEQMQAYAREAVRLAVAPVASPDVQAFVDVLPLPRSMWASDMHPHEHAFRIPDVQAFAVQAITAWQAAYPPVQPRGRRNDR